MAASIVKYLILALSLGLSYVTFRIILSDRHGMYPGSGKLLAGGVWLIYLLLLLIAAGVLHYFWKNPLLWAPLGWTLAMGVAAWAAGLGVEHYRHIRNLEISYQRQQSELQKRRETVRAYERDPKNPDLLIAMGEQALTSGFEAGLSDSPYRYGYVSDYYVEAIEAAPTYLPAYRALFGFIRQVKDRSDLEGGYDAPWDVAFYPYMEREYARRALEAAERGEWKLTEEERAFFRRAIEHAETWLKEIRDLPENQRAKREEILARIEEAIAAEPDNPEAWAKRSRFYANWQSDLDRAGEDIRKALSLDPENFEVQKSYGFYLARMGRCDEAARAYGKARELNPQESSLEYLIRECREREAAYGGEKGDVYTREFIASYRAKNTDTNRLYRTYAQLVQKRDPTDVRNLIRLARMHPFRRNEEGKIVADEGAEYLERAVEADPSSLEAAMYLAASYAITGEKEKLKALAEKVARRAEEGVLKLSERERTFFREVGRYEE